MTTRRWSRVLVRLLVLLPALLSAAAPVAAHWLLYDDRAICRGTAGVAELRWCTPWPQGLAAAPVPVPGGALAWLVARDGSLARLDLADGSTSPAIRLPEPVRALAVGSDGSVLLADHGAVLSLLDPHGRLLRRWPVLDRQGRPGQVLALADVPARRSFVVALRGLAELWEISYDPAAAPLFDGLVHDYRMGEAIARPGYLGLRRTPLERELQAIAVDGRPPWLLAGEAGAAAGAAVLHLDVRRRIAQLPGRLDAAALVGEAGRWTLVLADGPTLRWFDTRRWQRTRERPLGAPVRGLRAAAQDGTLWVLTQEAAGTPRLARWPAAADEPAATWEQAGAQIGPWWVAADGRTLTLLQRGAGGGVLLLDAVTLRPLQRWPRADPLGLVELAR